MAIKIFLTFLFVSSVFSAPSEIQGEEGNGFSVDYKEIEIVDFNKAREPLPVYEVKTVDSAFKTCSPNCHMDLYEKPLFLVTKPENSDRHDIIFLKEGLKEYKPTEKINLHKVDGLVGIIFTKHYFPSDRYRNIISTDDKGCGEISCLDVPYMVVTKEDELLEVNREGKYHKVVEIEFSTEGLIKSLKHLVVPEVKKDVKQEISVQKVDTSPLKKEKDKIPAIEGSKKPSLTDKSKVPAPFYYQSLFYSLYPFYTQTADIFKKIMKNPSTFNAWKIYYDEMMKKLFHDKMHPRNWNDLSMHDYLNYFQDTSEYSRNYNPFLSNLFLENDFIRPFSQENKYMPYYLNRFDSSLEQGDLNSEMISNKGFMNQLASMSNSHNSMLPSNKNFPGGMPYPEVPQMPFQQPFLYPGRPYAPLGNEQRDASHHFHPQAVYVLNLCQEHKPSHSVAPQSPLPEKPSIEAAEIHPPKVEASIAEKSRDSDGTVGDIYEPNEENLPFGDIIYYPKILDSEATGQ